MIAVRSVSLLLPTRRSVVVAPTEAVLRATAPGSLLIAVAMVFEASST